jgi:hypothetical protein
MASYKADPGILVYIDSLSGLVPARIVTVVCRADQVVEMQVAATAHRPAYRRGEAHWLMPHRIVPRDCVYRRRFGTYIRPYHWKG